LATEWQSAPPSPGASELRWATTGGGAGSPPADAPLRPGAATRPSPAASRHIWHHVVARPAEPVLHGVPVIDNSDPPADAAPDAVDVVLASYAVPAGEAVFLPAPPAERPVVRRSWSRAGLLVVAAVGAGVRTAVAHQAHRTLPPELARPQSESEKGRL
jgi:hypothetical protein